MGTVHVLRRDDNRRERLVVQVTRALLEVMPDVESFEDFEMAVLEITNEASRRCIEERLQQASDDLDTELLVDGELYRQHQVGTVVYHSLCGSLSVTRWTYRQAGVRNGPTVVPLELSTGLIERSTPALAFGIARGYVDLPMRDYEEHLRAAGRVPPSRSTLERTAKRIGTEVRASAARIEPKLRLHERVPDHAVAINIGLDRTTIPMEEDGEDGIEVRYRMAYLGTFALTDPTGSVLIVRRYAVPAHEGPKQLLRRLMADVRHALRQRPDLKLGVVQDGAPELWNLVREALRATPEVTSWRETYDRFHVMERLSRLLDLLEKEPQRRRKRYEEWNRRLDTRPRAIRSIENWLERTIHRHSNKRIREEAESYLGIYFMNHRQFRYASLKGTGLLQGSGLTEAACKTMVTQRAKRSGQRWRPEGISSLLALKTLSESDRLPGFWRHFRRNYVANVCAA